MQVTKGVWRMRKQCVPGSLSSSPAQEPGNEAGMQLPFWLPDAITKASLQEINSHEIISIEINSHEINFVDLVGIDLVGGHLLLTVFLHSTIPLPLHPHVA